MCPNCRAFITTDDKICPYCQVVVGPRAADRIPKDVVGGLIPHARQMGEVLFARLRDLAERHPIIGDVRGKGLLACLELVRDRANKTPLVPPNTDSPLPLQIRRKAWDEGIHVMARGSLIILSPPLIAQPEHIQEAVTKLDHVLTWIKSVTESA